MNSDQHAVRASRATVQDQPGKAIEIVLFDYQGRAVSASISAQRSLTIASELIAAARARLPE
jgi:hypothetical protein